MKFIPKWLASRFILMFGRMLSNCSSLTCATCKILNCHDSLARMKVNAVTATVADAVSQSEIDPPINPSLFPKFAPKAKPRINSRGAPTAAEIAINGSRLYSCSLVNFILFFNAWTRLVGLRCGDPLPLQRGHTLCVPTFVNASIRPYQLVFCGFGSSCFLDGWRRQQAGDALIQLKQKRHAFGVGGVGFFAAAGQVGGVYCGV